MTAVDVLRILGILAYGIFVGWIFYKMMKSADANEENEESKDEEEDLWKSIK